MSQAADWLRFAGEDLQVAEWADEALALARQVLAAISASVGG